MQVEVKIDENCKCPKIIIVADKMTDEIGALIAKPIRILPKCHCGIFRGRGSAAGRKRDRPYLCGKPKGLCSNGKPRVHFAPRLYELEERLNKRLFVRISNSEIVNLKKIVRLDLSMSGTICVELNNHSTAYVSRRYVTKIKQALGI